MLKLNINKASGPNDISPKLLRTCTNVLVQPLSLLCNSCFSSSIFPDNLKRLKIIPLHKQTEKMFVDNYRPMSLLNCFSKIFERLMYKQVINFLHKYALLYQYQFGFRENHLTTSTLIEIIEGIKNDIDKGDFIIWTYLDLTKAFDTIKSSHIVWKIRTLWNNRYAPPIVSKLLEKSQTICFLQ